MQCVFAAMPDNTINFGDHWFGAKPPAELKPGKASNPAELGGGLSLWVCILHAN